MEIEKAIEMLSETRLQYMYSIPDCMEYADEDTVEASESIQNVVDAINLAIQTLEKQVGKKVIPEQHNKYSPIGGECGVCLTSLRKFTKYCPECGQAIDWGDEQ